MFLQLPSLLRKMSAGCWISGVTNSEREKRKIYERNTSSSHLNLLGSVQLVYSIKQGKHVFPN